MTKFYVTTPVYYPNDVPHIGHAYTTIVADALARWHKLKGDKVRFLTGTDEHGKKMENTAKEKGKKPKEFVDKLVPKFKEAWKKLNIEYDRFIRTTDKDHEKKVREILQKVYDKGDIYLGEYEGYYCTGCEAYYTEKGLENGCCPIHKKKVDKLKEPSYFFKLSKYSDKLLKLYKENPKLILPKFRRNEVINRIKEGLQDLSISRTSFSWGIPLPFDEKHIAYVWFDALLNYVSGAGDFWPADVHLIGKDILWFHTVIWHSMLLSAGLKLPKTVFAHGWWTFDKEKISKSRGKVINVDELISIAGVDSARYFLFRETPFGDDGDFSEKALIARHNNELANKLGNLVSRVSSLVEKYDFEKKTRNQRLPERFRKALEKGNVEYEEIVSNIDSDEDGHVIRLLKIKQKEGSDGFLLSYPQVIGEVTQVFVKRYIETFQFDKALNIIFAYIDVCNEFIQLRKPWEESKSSEYRKWVLGEAVRAIREISELLLPFIPESAEKIRKQFSAKKIKKGEILFKKI